jgi:hypothetical protein
LQIKKLKMNQENFSPQQSLQLIDAMINKAKNRFNENGFLYLLWGWLILFCSVGHFILIKGNWFKHPEIIWASCWIAVIIQIIYLAKTQKKEKVKTYSEIIISYIWIGFGISMFVTAIMLEKLQLWGRLSTLYLLLYGMPTFLSGAVMQFKPLKVGGLACWLLTIASVFCHPLYGLLLLGAAVIVAWIIPGYLLKAKFKNQNS